MHRKASIREVGEVPGKLGEEPLSTAFGIVRELINAPGSGPDELDRVVGGLAVAPISLRDWTSLMCTLLSLAFKQADPGGPYQPGLHREILSKKQKNKTKKIRKQNKQTPKAPSQINRALCWSLTFCNRLLLGCEIAGILGGPTLPARSTPQTLTKPLI